MTYPTLEQYNEAFQNPKLYLFDNDLKKGIIRKTGLGTPLVLCGGFALTYKLTVEEKDYAIRCFHRKSDMLEKRYENIARYLQALKSNYFLNFEFQPKGIRIKSSSYPLLKMEWASGSTLCEFLEKNYHDKKKLTSLSSGLQKLAKFLEEKNIAHGDIQPGNIMISNDGEFPQLIDYDGMFVDGMEEDQSTELGHKNFQHPLRTSKEWNSKIDRFSFILLHCVLEILILYPDLWNEFQCDGDAILLKAHDFTNPFQSSVFNRLQKLEELSFQVQDLIAVCTNSFDNIPSLEDFIQKKKLPVTSINFTSPIDTYSQHYMAHHPVVNGCNYLQCYDHVGNVVELIGKVVDVKHGKTWNEKDYIFINFGDWREDSVKINIWSEGLEVLTSVPDASWEGQYVSVTGLMEPPYIRKSKKYNYSHLSLSVSQAGKLKVISEQEALFRLKAQEKDLEECSLNEEKKLEQNLINTQEEQEEGSLNKDVLKKIEIEKDKTEKKVPEGEKSYNQQIVERIQKSIVSNPLPQNNSSNVNTSANSQPSLPVVNPSSNTQENIKKTMKKGKTKKKSNKEKIEKVCLNNGKTYNLKIVGKLQKDIILKPSYKNNIPDVNIPFDSQSDFPIANSSSDIIKDKLQEAEDKKTLVEIDDYKPINFWKKLLIRIFNPNK